MRPTLMITLLVLASLIPPRADAGESPQYVGVYRCKSCHNRKDDTKQYDIWAASQHAQAYHTLGTDRARDLAAEVGVDVNPQEAPECLECHVTGYGVDSTSFLESFAHEDGVQCEACHGPGSRYKATKIMSRKKYKEDPDTQRQLALDAGLLIPDEQTCVRCHNEGSPAFKSFDYETYYEKIRHDAQP